MSGNSSGGDLPHRTERFRRLRLQGLNGCISRILAELGLSLVLL